MKNTTTSATRAVLALAFKFAVMLFAPGYLSAQQTVEDILSFQVAQTADELADKIHTGKVPQDGRSWWSCTVDANPVIEQLHLRLWQSGDGFSGHHAMKWQAKSASVITISIGKSSFELANIRFKTSADGRTLFSATDANGASVGCQWSGPRRGTLETELLFDQGSPLLESQLIANGTHQWQCQVRTKNGKVSGKTLRFNTFGVGVSDNDNFLWSVDRRFNVVLSYRNQVSVLRDVVFSTTTEQDDTFEAYELSEHLMCSRVVS